MTTRTRRKISAKTIVIAVIAVAIVIPSAIGFVSKMMQFAQGGEYSIVPIVNYLLVAAGFVCMLIWATLTGMFRDIEGPKHTMLEREDQLDRGALGRHG